MPPDLFLPPAPTDRALAALPRTRQAAVLALAWALGLACCAAFLRAYYISIFNSDAAAHQILAQAMVDEASLLPRDFAYGNQLILWRNNLFIAPMLMLGLEGFRAYGAGSALWFACLFLLAFLCIETLLADWRQSLAAAFLMFLPLGHTEADYVLGQQSHLALVVAALALAVLAYRATSGQRQAAAWCALPVFLLMVEAPTRTVMLVVPLALAVCATGRARSARPLALWVAAALLAGYGIHRALVATHDLLGIPALPLASAERFLARALELLKGFADFFIGFHPLAGAPATPANLVLYGTKTLVMASFAGLAGWLGWRLAHRALGSGEAAQPVSPLAFVAAVGVLGAMLGFWIVASIEYWLDIRHLLWALMLLKLVLVVWALRALAPHLPLAGRRATAVAAVASVAVLASTAATSFVFPGHYQRLQDSIVLQVNRLMHDRVQARMRELRIHAIYGDHWATLQLDVLIPPARGSTLGLAQGEVVFVPFLTRPSRRCAPGEVLYTLDRTQPTDDAVRAKLLAQGGRLLESFGPDRALYAGPPVWNTAGCP